MLTRLLRRLFPTPAPAAPGGQAARESPYRKAARPSASFPPGSLELLYESRSTLVRELVADANGLYFVDGDALLFVPEDAPRPEVIANTGLTVRLARADGDLFRARMTWGMSFTIERVTAGSAAVEITSGSGLVHGFAVGGAHLYWTHIETETDDSDKVIRAFRSSLYRVALSGGAPDPVLTRDASMTDLIADADHLSWIEREVSGRHRLMAMPHAGGALLNLAELRRGPPLRSSPIALAYDASHIYWSDERTMGISKVARAGGPVKSLCAGLRSPLALAAEEGTVYAIVDDPERARQWVGSLAPGASRFTPLGRYESAGGQPMRLTLDQIAVAGGQVYLSDGDWVFRLW
jgi:hypothetical protein